MGKCKLPSEFDYVQVTDGLFDSIDQPSWVTAAVHNKEIYHNGRVWRYLNRQDYSEYTMEVGDYLLHDPKDGEIFVVTEDSFNTNYQIIPASPIDPNPNLLFREKVLNVEGNRLTSLFDMLSLDAEINNLDALPMVLDFVEDSELEPGKYIPELWLVVRRTNELEREEGIINRVREDETV